MRSSSTSNRTDADFRTATPTNHQPERATAAETGPAPASAGTGATVSPLVAEADTSQAAPEGSVPTQAELRRRAARADGSVDAAEMLDIITDTIDDEQYIAQIMSGSDDFLKSIAQNEGLMTKIKEVMRRVNAAKDAYIGVMDDLGERRKKAAESIGRV